MNLRPPIVIARPGALLAAMRARDLSSRAVEAASGVSRSTVANVATKPDYGIAKDKADAIARAVDEPVGKLFVHRDGAPLT